MSKKLLNLCLATLLSVVSTAAWALSEVNGVYQIGTAADLEEFAQLVNGGGVYASAVLTADIDRGIDGTMIGTQTNEYQGFFDGAGHTIKINMYPEGDAALFWYTGYRAVIQNLKVTGTITTSNKFAAAIVARNKAVIRGCYSDVTINSSVAGDATHGGIVAVGYGGTTVENCLAKVTILGETTQNCGGVVGWAEKRVNIANCLVITDDCTLDVSNGLSSNISRNGGNLKTIDVETYNADPYANRPQGASYNNYVTKQWGDNVATTVVAYDDLADGRICYQLNNDQSKINWVQRIGTDPFPVPAAFGTGQVYASAATDCDGKSESELTFSNSGSDQATKHAFDKYGVCTVCGCFNFNMFDFDDSEKFDKKDMSVLLGTQEDFTKVEGWNRIANGFRLNMKLTNDIEFVTEPGQQIFNSSDWIDGNFNGQGHAITINFTEMNGYAGLFPEMAGNIENLILHGSLQTNGARVGSLCAEARNALVRNVYSDVDITSTVAGDNTSGGFFGWMGEVEKTVENCIYAGDFTLPEGAPYVRVGGFSGWAATKTYFNNCAVLGNIIGAGDQSAQSSTENSGNISRNWGSIVCENVYVVNPITGRDIADQDKYTHYENQAGIASGELAFFLNGKQNGLNRFFQVIGTDPEPMPFEKEGGLIYSAASSFRCDGTPLGSGGYTNDPSGEPVIPPHTFEDGWCSVCGQMDDNFITPVDGWFEISDGAQLVWWSAYANSHKDASARLTDDIDMADYMERFTPAQKFVGTFDGQGHTISNFVITGSGDYQGMISTICNGAVIKNFIFDSTCSINGNAFCGIIGGTDGSGDIYIEGVGNEGTVTTINQNAAGLLGVDAGGSMNLHIKNCYVSGTIIGGRESGAICGYSNANSVVENCWSTITIPQSAIYDSDSFTRGSAQVVNCYEADIEGVDANKQQHVRPMAENRRCNPITLEEVANGALCYKVNGSQFRDPSWYQTIEDDAHPYPFGDHAIVIYGADQYFSVLNDADLESVAASIHSYEQEAIGETVATQSLLDKLNEKVEALTEVASINDFADALDSVYAAKAAVKENAAVYQAYIDKCEEIKAFLASNDTFSGALRDALEYYLSEENSDEPSEDNPLGTYEYIIEKHTATAEEIAAETERVDQWLQKAIASDYAPGSDISKLIPNSDFSQQNEKWTGGFANSWGTTTDEAGTTFNGVEAWNKTGDMYQTVEEMKPGYYLIGTHAAFRPSNNRYSVNYASGIYANGIFNYFPAAIEDPVSVDEAEDGVNCNLTIKSAFDLPIYEDNFSTEGEEGLTGYVPQGETGMAIAAKAGRYQAYTIAYVGEDGKLTIGIKNPGTKYSSDWTGWSALEVKYCGDDETLTNPALDEVLENMSARAQTIVDNDLNCEDIYYNGENVAKGPNFPVALRDALQAAVDQVGQATTVEDKAALVKTFSDLFQQVYEGKQAYIELINYANKLDFLDTGNLPLVEKDEESGEWFETGEMVFSEDETNAVFDATSAIVEAYLNGSYSTEEALNPKSKMTESAAAIASILPEQDEEGYYLIGNTKEFVVYRAIASEMDKYAKGKLTADIDMQGIGMLPIGHNRGENAEHIFAGVLDGQGHALSNVYIDDARIPSGDYAEPATLFYELQNATVKNFKLTGEMYTSHQFSGPITRWMSGKSTIDNVEIDVAFHLAPNLAGDTSSGGVIGRNGSANSLINNCLVKTHLIGDGAEDGVGPFWYVGGVAGWADASLKIQNTLILSEYTNVGAEGDNSRTTSRGTKATLTNVFVSQFFREAEGTLATPEQLASGEITWKLNGSTGDDPAWFQTLGTEPTPHLFGGDAVYLYAGQYTNDKPNPQLNAFAYNLDAKVKGDKVIVNFDLNAEAESAEVQFYNGEELVYTEAISEELASGAQSVTVESSKLGADPTTLNFKVAVTGKGSLDVLRMGASLKVWGPYGMAINNNPASKNFGQVLIAESYPQEIAEVYISHDKPGAIYAFGPDFKPINAADGTPGFYGGLPIRGEDPLSIVGTSYKFDLKDLRFTDDGRLFVARAAGLTPSSVYEINPEDLNEPWKPVFTGGELDEATGITYVGDDEQTRMALSLAFDGAGEDLKMFVLGGQRSAGGYFATDYNCSVYNLGTAKEWTGAPSANFVPLDGVYTKSPVDVGIFEDGQGGLWYIQRRSDVSAEVPAIKHFDAEGNEDYSNISSTTVGGRIAVTTNGNYLAIPTANGTVVLYETNYVPMENGKIFLNPKKTINVGESRVTALAFDYADNLYVASASTETFSRYTIPTENKVVVTPGNGIGLASGDVNCDGDVSIADGVAVLNAMAGQEVPGNADVNGDGEVSIADFVAVLNIMAGQ
jgi:hypothetical protein